MKIGEIARVTPARTWGDGVSIVLAAVDLAPGSTTGQLSRRLDLPEGTIASTLWRLNAKGRIKRIQQDFKYRYYPSSYIGAPTSSGVQVNFKCPECDKPLKSKLAVARHRRMAHTEEGAKIRAKAIIKKKTQKIGGDSPSRDKLIALAKDYYWATSDDSLRGFIKWASEQTRTGGL